jgi:ABC-type lipoprotein release transport system permease subunit
MLLKIAWRNVLAHKRRAILTIILSALCTVFLVFAYSFQQGEYKKMIRDAVEVYAGYMEVTGAGYLDKPDYDHLIYNLPEVKKIVQDQEGVEKYTERMQTFALFSGEQDSAGGMLVGIVPETEQYLSRIKQSMVEGEFLTSTTQPYAIIGKDLADKLEVKIGDKFTYLSTALDYSMAADNLVIKGIFQTGSQFDSRAVFISKKYMDTMFLSQGVASHLMILPTKKYRTNTTPLLAQLKVKIDPKQNQVVDWRTTIKYMVQLIKVDEVFGYFMFAILVGVIFLVIMIFSVISIMQRTKEIGVLRAIGTKPGQVYAMLLAESFILGLISAMIGGLIGAALVYYYMVNPIQINMSPEVMKQYQQWGIVDLNFPTVFSIKYIVNLSLFVIFMNIVSALYPILKVVKYKPIEAINYV